MARLSLLLALVGLVAGASDGCCLPQQYSFRLLGSAFAGDLGVGQTVTQYIARSNTFVAWRFEMAGVQANSSIGWVGFADGGNGDITNGYEFEVSGSVGMCCKAARGGSLEWVVPPRCTKDFGLKRSGNITLVGVPMVAWSKWLDPVLGRRWTMITTPDCVPLSSTGSDARSFYMSYYDNTGYTAADWDTSSSVLTYGKVPAICNNAPLCADPNWRPPIRPPTAAVADKPIKGSTSGPNLGLNPNDLLLHPDGLPAAPKLAVALPDAFDWDLDKRKLTPVTNQNPLTCGACWAHAAAAAIESVRAIFGDGELVPLSIQQLIDCQRGTFSQGCGGGSTMEAFEYAKLVGLSNASSYPLSNINGACDIDPTKPKVKIPGWNVAKFAGNETAMRATILLNGPLVVGTSTMGWGLYSGGVLTTCGSGVSHVVLVTGWGVDNGIPYWRVRNSFGASWGERGYIRVARGNNLCGMETAGFWVMHLDKSTTTTAAASNINNTNNTNNINNTNNTNNNMNTSKNNTTTTNSSIPSILRKLRTTGKSKGGR